MILTRHHFADNIRVFFYNMALPFSLIIRYAASNSATYPTNTHFQKLWSGALTCSASDTVNGLAVHRFNAPVELLIPRDVVAAIEDNQPAFLFAESVQVARELA